MLQRKRSEETRKKISNSLKGRVLTSSHKEAISKSLTKAWQRVPLDPNHPEGKNIMLDVYTDNNGNKKIYHNGTEIKNEL